MILQFWLIRHDAPPPGARLETKLYDKSAESDLMPPTRGHDLKLSLFCEYTSDKMMPPTRGHDLKLLVPALLVLLSLMPPTRGHDLKLFDYCNLGAVVPDAPHTGARLETNIIEC